MSSNDRIFMNGGNATLPDFTCHCAAEIEARQSNETGIAENNRSLRTKVLKPLSCNRRLLRCTGAGPDASGVQGMEIAAKFAGSCFACLLRARLGCRDE